MSCVSQYMASACMLGFAAWMLTGCGASNQAKAPNTVVKPVVKHAVAKHSSAAKAKVRTVRHSQKVTKLNDGQKKYQALRAAYQAKWHAEQARQKARQREQYRQKWLAEEKKREAKRQQARERHMAMNNVVAKANEHIGRKYVWGGATPKTGFDCSGLVQHSYRVGAGRSLPRTAAQQYKFVEKISPKHARKGDLVFFKTRGNRVSHVGLYVGGNRFLHAPRRGKRISYDNIAGYWKKRLVGFGRIPGACRIPSYS